jgi:hypothetical protein
LETVASAAVFDCFSAASVMCAQTAMRSQQFEIDQADAFPMLTYFEMYSALKRVLEGKEKAESIATVMDTMDAASDGLRPSRKATMNSDWTNRRREEGAFG